MAYSDYLHGTITPLGRAQEIEFETGSTLGPEAFLGVDGCWGGCTIEGYT